MTFCPDGYTFVSSIGVGGFGRVDHVFHSSSPGIPLALKYPLATGDDEAQQRFTREVRLQSQLRHDNILPIVDFDTNAHPPWFVSPLARGNLSDFLSDMGLMQALDVFRQIAAGVEFAHMNHVLHRDLKPENVLLFQMGNSASSLRACVSDFGLGRPFTRGETFNTETGQGFGTPFYAAPEQWTSFKEVTSAADIYSLGKILLAVLEDASAESDSKAVADSLRYCVKRATVEDPADRYETVAHLLDDFDLLSTSQSLLERPAETAVKLLRQAMVATDKAIALRNLAEFLAKHSDDYSTLVGVLPRIPVETLRALIEQHPAPMRTAVTAYARALEDPLPLNGALTAARFLDQCVDITSDADTKSAAIRSIIRMASRYGALELNGIAAHRIYVEQSPSAILEISNLLRDDAAARAWALTHLDRRVLPGAIRRRLESI